MIEVLKVSSRSNPNAVAGALAGVVRAARVVEIQVVGAGALNQAIKAVAIARGYLAPSGVDLVCVPTFADIHIDGERRTAIRLLCEDRGAVPTAKTVDLRAAGSGTAAAEPPHAVGAPTAATTVALTPRPAEDVPPSAITPAGATDRLRAPIA